MKKIVKCRFLNKEHEPTGREYSYYTEIPVEIGQLVDVPAPQHQHSDQEAKTRTVMVSSVDVPESEIAGFADKVKTIVGIHEDKPSDIEEDKNDDKEI